jgi:hypothetical protein
MTVEELIDFLRNCPPQKQIDLCININGQIWVSALVEAESIDVCDAVVLNGGPAQQVPN